MTDTTPMIAWLERQHPDPAVIPTDPATAFIALLIEDFGDEWLWRPDEAAGRVEGLLREHGCWEPLWRVEGLDSGHDPEDNAPFGVGARMVRDGGLLVRR